MSDLTAENEVVGVGRDQFTTTYMWGGNTGVRKIQVPFEGYEDKVTEILGWTDWEPGNPGRFLRYLPWKDPALWVPDGTEDLGNWVPQTPPIATRCEVKGLSYDGQDPADPLPNLQRMTTRSKYRQVEITIFFESARFDVGALDPDHEPDPDEPTRDNLGLQPDFEHWRYTVKEVRPGRELIKAQMGGFVYAEPPYNQVPYEIVRQLGYEDIFVTWLQVPRLAVPVTAIAECFAKTNETIAVLPPFPPPAFYEEETLVFNNWEFFDAWMPNGTKAIDIRYHFRRRAYPLPDDGSGFTRVAGWNYAPRQAAPGVNQSPFVRLYRKGSQPMSGGGDGSLVGPYETADFAGLFLPEPA